MALRPLWNSQVVLGGETLRWRATLNRIDASAGSPTMRNSRVSRGPVDGCSMVQDKFEKVCGCVLFSSKSFDAVKHKVSWELAVVRKKLWCKEFHKRVKLAGFICGSSKEIRKGLVEFSTSIILTFAKGSAVSGSQKPTSCNSTDFSPLCTWPIFTVRPNCDWRCSCQLRC